MDIQPSTAHSGEQSTSLPAHQPDTRSATAGQASASTRAWWQAHWVSRLALVLILLVGAHFRLLNITAWDAGTGQHPDERFFTSVASTVHLPSGPAEYFDAARSPLNPRNYSQFPLYVYGPLPLLMTRLVAVALTPADALPATVPTIAAPPTAGTTNFGPAVPNPERMLPRLTPLQQLLNPAGVNLTTYGEIVNVGRILAVLFDLASILLVYLIGARLFGRAAGLLAALLSALTVMQIQQAHFFVDPIFSTFFALLTLYWAVRIVQQGHWFLYAAAGISIGLAMATRITLATLALTVILATGLAALAAVRRAGNVLPSRDPAFWQCVTAAFFSRHLPLLFLAGGLAFLTFRTFQPDAFAGATAASPPIPHQVATLDWLAGRGYFDLRPDPRFVQNLADARGFVSGEIDFPPSQQWVRRLAYLFPWQNMVLWGMGPALGLTAWAGWGLFGWRAFNARGLLALVAGRRRDPQAQAAATSFSLHSTTLAALTLWFWVAFYFAWQGAQFAITLRYLLPIYGPLTIFAAWLLLRLWERGHAAVQQRAALPRAPRLAFLQVVTLLVLVATFGWAYAFTRIYTQPHSRAIAAQWILDHVEPGATIAAEVWDDPLPLQVAGYNPWGLSYQGLETAPYAEDRPEKYYGSFAADGSYQPGLLDQLDQADYITLTSNRVYDSTQRLPYRYPALMRYYHYLFNGELGFELVAEITSYPRVLGFAIPDQVAEEAFSVYDHPRVLIFRKTADYSRERAEALITSDVTWGEVYRLPVSVADRTATALRLTEGQWPAYRAAGTWSSLFDRTSLVNSVAPLVWLLLLQLLGLAAFALLFHLLPALPDRGYSLAKTLGLLWVAYAAWLLASLGAADGQPLLAFTPLSVWLCAAPLLLGGAWTAWRSRAALRNFWQERGTALLSAEAVFLAFFVLGLLLRWFNPDLWHPARGGEKPMDFAYLNAVLKSAAFPPYDPWHAGGYINYYYFGFVIVGALVHLSGVLPAIAYNLAVALLFALTAIGAWGVVYNLLAPRTKPHLPAGRSRRLNWLRAPGAENRARRAALLAPVFVLLLGNLAQALWFVNGYAAAQAASGRSEWAFWDATRIIAGTVNEFPFFTFLFADLHAHMIVLPFSLALLGLSVAVVRSGTLAFSWRHGAVVLLMAGLAGTLRATNTWDYPTYVGLTLLTLLLVGLYARRPRERVAGFLRWLLQAGLVVLGGNLLFLPFIRNFVTESGGAELWRDGSRPTLLTQLLSAERTPLSDLLRMHGLWLFLLVSAGLWLGYRLLRDDRDGRIAAGLLAGGTALLALLAAIAGWNALLLLVPLLAGAAWLAWRMRHLPPRMLLPLLWAGAALGLAALVELVVVRGDVGRLNTVFKFGLHAWTLFALSSAIALPWLWRSLAHAIATARASGKTERATQFAALRTIWSGAAILLLVAATVYPLTATPARIADRFAPDLPRTLDGSAFLASAITDEQGAQFPLAEDAAAIAWLQDNVAGTPVIVEAHLPSYRWAGRVATYTGLPTILGWEWHQIQQRTAVQANSVIAHRQAVVQQIYSSADAATALDLLDAYAVEYVIVGGVERAIYDPVGLAKFDKLAADGRLELVFNSGATSIYSVPQPGEPTMLTSDLPVVAPTLRTPPPLMLDQPVNELPAVGGYAWNTLANQQQWLAVLLWLFVLYGLALLGLPLALLAFGGAQHPHVLSDGGFVWARFVGLLVLGYAVWLPVSLGLWQYDQWGLFGGLLLVLLLNLGLLARIGRGATEPGGPLLNGLRRIATHLQAHRRAVLIGEALFLVGFAFFVALRALNPDLWHPIWGGEKPMGFGFLNAIVRSPVMPPYDPFFSDGYINYYYYGLYLVSLLIKITGIHPAIAFNLMLPTLFALTLSGAFAVVLLLSGRVRYALVGAAFVALAGNLASVFPVGWSQGLAPAVSALREGSPAGFGARLGDWYFGVSRVIPFTINEFPFWSFLFADLHPHLIALPFTLLAVALAYRLLTSAFHMPIHTTAGDPLIRAAFTATCALTALTLGSLAVTNSWDFPTYALLMGGALAGAAWRIGPSLAARLGLLLRAALLAAVLAIGGLVLFAPFFDHFYALVSGLGRVQNFTSVRDYLLIYGPFLAVLLPFVLGALGRLVLYRLAAASRQQRLFVLYVAGMLLFGLVLLVFVLPNWGLRLWLLALLLACAALLLNRRLAAATWFTLLLAALAWSVSLGVETVFIRDHLAGGDWYRMNTVFKFGLQIWTLLALAAAAALPLLWRGLARTGGLSLQLAWGTATAGLVALTLVFLPIGIPSRLADRFPLQPAPTLDGLAFLRSAEFVYDCAAFGGCEPGSGVVTIDLRGDAAAIEWLNREIRGTPIVVQSPLWFYRGYGIRVAANTGLPTVISGLHVNEQRDPALAAAREDDINLLYRTTDVEQALRLLARYRVNYVYVGSVERAIYNSAGLQKFASLQGTYLDEVYNAQGVQIYRVGDIPPVYAMPEPYNFTVAPQPERPAPPATVSGLEELAAEWATNPSNASVAFGLAERYRDAGRLTEAVRVLQVAANANPADIGLHHLWGDILTMAGRYAEAEQAYLQAAQALPTAGNWNKLGAALLAWGEFDKAELALNQAVEIDPTAPDPYYYLALLYQERGVRENAVAMLDTYLLLAADGQYSAEARALLAELQP